MNAVAIQAPRLPYHPAVGERFPGVDQGAWRVLTDAVFPAAERPESIIMALAYCKARNLDIFKKPVQIVPIYDKKRGGLVDTVWPGIAELRTTAMWTGSFAGFDDTAYGPMIEDDLGGVTLAYPEWAQCTVYRTVGGQRVPFVGPKVFWMETYATARRDSKAPNSMWTKRPRGQVEKCAEAAALRRAFPEELGNEYAAEEIEGHAFGSVRDVTPKPSGLAARLGSPMPATEGFSTADIDAALDSDQIPEHQAPSAAAPPEVADEGTGSPATSLSGDYGAAAPDAPNMDDLLGWATDLTAEIGSMDADAIRGLLASPTEGERFKALEAAKPGLAQELNRIITDRRRELGDA